MNRSLRRSLIFALAALTAAIVWYERSIANRVPDLELVSIKGEKIHLSELRGKPVMVTFWASDCRSCIEEIPDLEALHRDYGTRGLHIMAVAMAYDVPRRVVEFTRARQTPYRVILDSRGIIADSFGGVSLVPTSFLIGADGRIIRHDVGRLRADSWRADIEHVLGDP